MDRKKIKPLSPTFIKQAIKYRAERKKRLKQLDEEIEFLDWKIEKEQKRINENKKE